MKSGSGMIVTTRPDSDNDPPPPTREAVTTRSPPAVSSGSLSFASTSMVCGGAGCSTTRVSGRAMGATFTASVTVTWTRPVAMAPSPSVIW